MEGEVDELERLRRVDEERARQEAERQRQLEAERARDAERALEAQRLREQGRRRPCRCSPRRRITAPASSPPARPAREVTQSAPPAAGQAKRALRQPAPAPAAGTGDPQATAPAPPPKPPASRPTRTKRPLNPFSDTFSQ